VYIFCNSGSPYDVDSLDFSSSFISVATANSFLANGENCGDSFLLPKVHTLCHPCAVLYTYLPYWVCNNVYLPTSHVFPSKCSS